MPLFIRSLISFMVIISASSHTSELKLQLEPIKKNFNLSKQVFLESDNAKMIGKPKDRHNWPLHMASSIQKESALGRILFAHRLEECYAYK